MPFGCGEEERKRVADNKTCVNICVPIVELACQVVVPKEFLLLLTWVRGLNLN